jgi:hypothetical protein
MDIELPPLDDTDLNSDDTFDTRLLPSDEMCIESDPKSWPEMLASPNKRGWLAAIESELSSHDQKGPFKEVKGLPKGYIALGSR